MHHYKGFMHSKNKCLLKNLFVTLNSSFIYCDENICFMRDRWMFDFLCGGEGRGGDDLKKSIVIDMFSVARSPLN